jgi:hypothetical protein
MDDAGSWRSSSSRARKAGLLVRISVSALMIVHVPRRTSRASMPIFKDLLGGISISPTCSSVKL